MSDPARLEELASKLIDQRDEPWPGRNADRIHYWRTKCIEVGRALRALAQQGER